MALADVVVVVVAVAVWGLCAYLMWKGWRRRARVQGEGIGELYAPPGSVSAPVVEETSGLYVGSSLAGNWQARVAASGLGTRAVAFMTGYREGVLIERDGAEPLWIPRTAIVSVRTDRRLAGKVMTKDGLLVVRWRTAGTDGDVEIDSGFRGDDKGAYRRWLAEFDTGRPAPRVDEAHASAADAAHARHDDKTHTAAQDGKDDE